MPAPAQRRCAGRRPAHRCRQTPRRPRRRRGRPPSAQPPPPRRAAEAPQTARRGFAHVDSDGLAVDGRVHRGGSSRRRRLAQRRPAHRRAAVGELHLELLHLFFWDVPHGPTWVGVGEEDAQQQPRLARRHPAKESAEAAAQQEHAGADAAPHADEAFLVRSACSSPPRPRPSTSAAPPGSRSGRDPGAKGGTGGAPGGGANGRSTNFGGGGEGAAREAARAAAAAKAAVSAAAADGAEGGGEGGAGGFGGAGGGDGGDGGGSDGGADGGPMKSPLAVNRTPYVTPRAIGGAKPITVLSTSTTSSSSRRPPQTRSNSEVTISTRQSTGSRSGRSGAVKNS